MYFGDWDKKNSDLGEFFTTPQKLVFRPDRHFTTNSGIRIRDSRGVDIVMVQVESISGLMEEGGSDYVKPACISRLFPTDGNIQCKIGKSWFNLKFSF